MGHLTSVHLGAIDALTYKNGRGRQDWLRALLFPSFEKGEKLLCSKGTELLVRNITLERFDFWSVRPNGTSAKNWTRTPVSNGQ
jgi:hypothetical protein